MDSASIHVLTVFGTRPEAIKLAPVLAELERRPAHVRSTVCVTGQHREMLDQMLGLFAIVPDHDLDIMEADQSLNDILSRVAIGVENVVRGDRPDWVVVQGDTTTTMAASLAAFHMRVPVAHVEAGLRTGRMSDPMPEELNRRIASLCADLHFAPTDIAAANLSREGIPLDRIRVTGNTVIDAFRMVSELPFRVQDSELARLRQGARIVLATVHRRENHGESVAQICNGLRRLAELRRDIDFVVPVHLNPNVEGVVYDLLGGLPNILLMAPLSYQALAWTLTRAELVITDSGGLQEEAVGLGKPVVVLRESTERMEGVHAGLAHLVGSNADRLCSTAGGLLDWRDSGVGVTPTQLYGDGMASLRIADALCELPHWGDDAKAEVPAAEYAL